MTDWIQWVGSVASLAGIGAAVANLISIKLGQGRSKEDLKRLEEDAQARALDSVDRETVANYLSNDIGLVRLSDVVSNENVRLRTLAALARVADFVDTQDEGGDGIPANATMAEGSVGDAELVLAQRAILEGDVWSGLARIRRHIEVALRELTELRDSRMTAGRLISAAEKMHVLSADVVPALRYSVRVANEAIHGEPVTIGQALEALESAEFGLRGLDSRTELG